MSAIDHGPAILTAAIVGAETTRAQNPNLPLSPPEIGVEAARCRDHGAAIIHLHVREADGRPSQSRELFAAAIDEIRRRTDVIIQTSTGGAVGMTAEERAQPVSLHPEMATLNCGSLNFGDEIFENPFPLMRRMAELLREAGVTPELELYELGHLDNALILRKEGLIGDPMHVQFVLGVRGGLAPSEARVKFLVSELPAASTWGVAGIGRHQLPMVRLALTLGGNARVGLEDNVFVQKGVLAQGSWELCEEARRIAREVGRPLAMPDEARALLGLPARLLQKN
jgi:3-keto-5-aminohexanoate cleavage enzyme